MRNLGDNQRLKVDFHSPQTVAKSGAVLTSAFIQNGKMVYTAGGLKIVKNLDFLFTRGGTIRLRFKNTNTGANNHRAFVYAKDSENRILVVTNETNNQVVCAMELAGVEGLIITSMGASMNEIVMVMAPAGAKMTMYRAGALVGAWAAAAIHSTAAVYGTVMMGDTDVLDPTGECDILEVYDTQWTAEEVLDAYQQDTYQEIDASRLDVDLPLRSWFTKETGSELLVDGDMEAATTAAFSSVSAAVLSKEVGARTGGSGSKVLRIGYGGIANPIASQLAMVSGKKYRATGWGRGDGTVLPYAKTGAAVVIWSGTVSTSWQYFDVTFISDSNTLYLRMIGSSGYVEFDDVSVFEVLDQTQNLGTAGNFLMGDGRTVASQPTQLSPKGVLIDTTQYLSKTLTIASTKTFSVGYLINFKDTGTVATHFNFVIGSYSVDGFMINQYGKNIYVYRNSASVSWNAGSILSNGLNSIVVVSDAGNMTLYLNGIARSTSDQTAKAALSGSYTVWFGTNAGNSAEADLLALKVKFGEAFTPRQVKNLHFRMLESLNR